MREQVLYGLGVLYNRTGEQTEAMLDEVIGFSTLDRDVNSLSSWIVDDIKRRNIKAAWERGDSIMKGYEGTPVERLERAVTEVLPLYTSDQSVTEERDTNQMMDFMDAEFDLRREQFLNGIAPGPSLKFRG